MRTVLLIEDAAELAVALRTVLEEDGLKVDTAASIAQAKDFLGASTYDIIVLDVKLPDGDGFEFFSSLRSDKKHADVPLFFLTSVDDLTSKIGAFALGADDYIVKPTNLLEFKARIQARLKKSTRKKENPEFLTCPPFEFDLKCQRLKVPGSSETIELTPREFRILLFLARRPDQVLSRSQILKEIVGPGVYVSERTIDAHVCLIRKKLGKYGDLIESITGEGYRYKNVKGTEAA